ncbi:hypothetical protein VOLCADRAFT_104049 [Volvox carteri f. nagariensis]|uniref:VHS domain-containing protein n=1 Tax=Volvox carteri f. nagariensis TaxID=3068 RepID=D8TQW3_VOLCA|nr:uncharacterized protein VOLCADRAFT_104049 [Volvox carteri f. nagariensis]EFJ50225.1 hypothetical protein VOLCADRAFT_104049 [Volvox carteri f. nagariensis]|eukprot:XP_002948845.1 hypothetical protein VOLCADRAFT_104049 [Volvox carteri f. nagariensis]
MAAKIKEGLRDITHGVVERLKGGPKYADNLLGESLQDQLRKATAKELLEPSEELASQVVDTINLDIANGKDSKPRSLRVSFLPPLGHTDRWIHALPGRTHFLSVSTAQIIRPGLHLGINLEIVGLLKKRLRTDNPHKQWLAVLLVGRVMRDCSPALDAYREELLEEVARVMARPARQDTIAAKDTRQAAKELLRSYGRAGTSAFRAATRSTIENGNMSAEYAAAINAAVAREAVIVVEEVKAMIEQARANTELLSEMLVAQGGQGGPPGGQQQLPQLPQGGAGTSASGPAADDFENELTRELVTELQSMSGEPQVEEITMKALEAVDMLDGALALQKDVASNQREIEQQATGAATGAIGVTRASGVAVTTSRVVPSGDLIMLDDFSDAMLPQPPAVLGGNPAAATPPAALAAVASAEKALPSDPFAALDPVAVQAVLSPGTAQTQPPQAPQSAVAAGQPPYTSTYGSYPQQVQQPQPQPQQYAYTSPQQQSYGMYGMAAAATAVAATNANNPFAAPAVPSLPFGGAAQPSPSSSAATVSPSTGGNPFDQAANATSTAAAAGNPFGLLAAPSGGSHSSTMDSEWAMFFANRTAGAAPATQQR